MSPRQDIAACRWNAVFALDQIYFGTGNCVGYVMRGSPDEVTIGAIAESW